jgi:hypothetical protein
MPFLAQAEVWSCPHPKQSDRVQGANEQLAGDAGRPADALSIETELRTEPAEVIPIEKKPTGEELCFPFCAPLVYF